MATKSVIQIDVLDESFKKFQQAFDKYQAALKKMPGDWQKVNQTSAGGAQTLNKHLEKSLKNLQEFDKKVKDANKDLKETEKSTSNIAQNLANSVVSLARWVTLGSIGGGFGLGALGASASDYRRQAQGLGISTGGLRAANVNLGRYINPGQVLGNIADIQNDLSRRPILNRLGLGAGQNAEQALPTIITNAIKLFNQGGKTSQYAQAMGLTQVFSLEELRRLSSLSQKELQETFKKLKQDRDTLSVDDETSRKWQNFWVQLKRSGNDLETKLIDKLVALAPAFEKLSEGITKFITSLLDSPKLKVWIENLGSKIEDFGKYLTSPEFQQDIEDFYENVKNFGLALKSVTDYIQDFFKTPEQRNAELKAQGKLTPETMNLSFGQQAKQLAHDYLGYHISDKDDPKTKAFKEEMAKGGVDRTKAYEFLRQIETQKGLPPGILDMIWMAESSRGKNMLSPKGAMGHFGFMPKTAQEYGLSNPNDFASSADAAARKIKQLIQYYHGNVPDALAAYNWGEGNLNQFLSGKPGLKLPQETAGYLGKFGYQVNVNNASGGDLVITTNAMK